MSSLVIFFTLHIIQIVKTTIFNQTLYFFQNEYIPTQYPIIALPQNQNQSQLYQALVQEYNITQQFSLPISQQARVFSLLKSNNQDINLAILEDQRLSFIFNIKTYLSNKQLLIQPINYTLLLPHHNYFALYYLNNESYILLSKLQEEKILIQILNLNLHPSQQNFTIKNLTFVDYNPLCKVDSAFMFSLLVLFQQYCHNSTISTYQIDLNKYEIADQTTFNLDYYNYSNQQIIQIHICSTKSFKIITLNYLLSINITSQKVKMDNLFTKNNFWNYVMIGCNQVNLYRNFENQTNESMINIFLLQKILILQRKDNVIVHYSANCSIIIRKSFSQLFALFNLPYLIGVTITGELLAFRVTIPRTSFTHMNSSQMQLLRYASNTKFYNDPYIFITSDIQILSESQPKFLINQNEQFFKLINSTKFMFFSSKIQQSLPLQIKQIRANGKQINFQEDNQYFNCNFDRSGLQVLLIIGLQNNQHLVLIIKENTNKLLINLCSNRKFSTIKQVIINQGFFKIIPSIDKPHFYIVQSYQLKIFDFVNLKLLEKTLQFKSNIIDGNFVENQICILLIDCNEMCFEFKDQDIHLQKQFKLQQSECNNDKALHRGLFFIDEHQIFFKNTGFQEQLTINETIIKAEIIISQFQVLLFIKNEQHLQIKILSYFHNELQFLYNCPLYGFVLRFPLYYKLFNNFLMILADDPMHNSPVVLIFDLNNRSITSLIQVIQIDEDLLQFDFIYNSRGFFYVYQNSIQIKQLDFQLIILEKAVETTNVIVSLEYQLFFQNPITDEIVNSNQTFEYFNNHYQLSLIDKDIQMLLSNDGLNMSNIYSNIKSVDIIPTNDFKIQTPLEFTKDITICQFYSKECCIYQSYLKCQLKNETYSTEIKELFQHIYFIECNEHLLQCTIMLLQKQEIILSTFTLYNDQQPKVVNTILQTQVWFDQDFDCNLNFKDRNGDITIFLSESNRAIYIFQSFQVYRQIRWNFLELRNYLFQARKTTDQQNYLFLFESEQTIFYIFIPISLNYVYYPKMFQDLDMTSLQTCFTTQDLLKKLYKSVQRFILKYEILQIIEFNVVNEKIDIDLLILLEEQNGFILNLQIDPSQQVNCTFEIIKTIRYPQNSKLNRLLYADGDLIIISVSQQEEQNIILYDLIQSKNLQLIHSIFTFPDDNYIKIEKYNRTHYQIIRLKDQDYELEIIKISQYKLERLNSQNQMAKLIFKNEVSELTINLQITNQENSLLNHSKFIIIIMATLVLQIYIIFIYRNKRVLKK